MSNIRLPASSAVPVSPGAGVPCSELMGWAFREDAAGAAVINLRDGTATGDVLAPVNLASGQTASREYLRPIQVPSGTLWVEEVSGSFAPLESVIYK